MEKIVQTSSWNLPPTDSQIYRITKQCIRLGITESLEDKPSNRLEARNLINELRRRKK